MELLLREIKVVGALVRRQHTGTHVVRWNGAGIRNSRIGKLHSGPVGPTDVIEVEVKVRNAKHLGWWVPGGGAAGGGAAG